VSAERVGRIVGDRYHIVRELGRGGMGVVYLGRDLRRDMDVAIKICGREDADAMRWLKREFRVVASLRHPNLVELFELVAYERSCYFTMEYLVGTDPRRWVAKSTRAAQPTLASQSEELVHRELSSTSTLDPLQPLLVKLSPTARSGPRDVEFSRIRSVLAQTAEALAFLHARGVIHRDVKSSNVLVVDGTAKLMDFGLALERRRISVEVDRKRLVGTPAYMAPEYIESLTVTPAIDVFALGVIAFELATGTQPFGNDLRQRPMVPRASRLNPDVPRDLDDLIDDMLATNPLRRPTALAVATRLAGSLTQPRPVRRELFVGRAAELERLTGSLADSAPHARFVIVTGPSGVGKSALVEAAVGRARIAGTLPVLVWRGRCHERELIPFRAFDFVIDDLAAAVARENEDPPIEHAGALGRVFPALGATLKAQQPAAGDLRVERDRALLALTQLLDLAIGDDQGLVVIDDLQWADEDSLELLSVIIERATRPLAIIATWSDDEVSAQRFVRLWERLGARAELLPLAPMGEDELAELVAGIAPAAPAQQLHAAVAVAGGMPYLAELVARDLAETGDVDARSSELRRLERLGEAERAVVELAALSTSNTSFEQLHALCNLPTAQLRSVLRALEDARVIKVAPSANGDPVYALYHARLGESARAAMSIENRRELHLRFALFGERDYDAAPELIAHHYELAGEREPAARWATAAADAARAQLAWGVAADLYARAVRLGAGAGREQLAECLFLGGKLAEAAETFEQLARDSSVHEASERWRVRAAESYMKLGELDRGLAVLDGVLARRGEPRAKSRAIGAARAVAVAARWLTARGSRAPVDDVLVSVYRVIASFLSTPYPIEAFEYVLRNVDAAERAGDRDARGVGMSMLAAYLAAGSLGRFGERAIAEARRLASDSGAPYSRMVTAGCAGIVAMLRGDWTAMRRSHDEAHRICLRLGLERSWEASFVRSYQALGEYYAGEPTRALAILDELTSASDDLISRAMLGSYRGRALLLLGDVKAAHRQDRELDRAPAAQRGLAGIYRYVFAGELALAEHDWERAEAIGNELARSARSQWLSVMPAVSAMIDTLVATAAIGRNNRADAKRARARARGMLRRAQVSFYAPTALRLWGQAELRLGNVAAGRAMLARASAIAVKQGGKVDRLAIERLLSAPPFGGAARSGGAGPFDLLGTPAALGPLAFAVRWSTGGMV
jgi:hypothetical protein